MTSHHLNAKTSAVSPTYYYPKDHHFYIADQRLNREDPLAYLLNDFQNAISHTSLLTPFFSFKAVEQALDQVLQHCSHHHISIDEVSVFMFETQIPLLHLIMRITNQDGFSLSQAAHAEDKAVILLKKILEQGGDANLKNKGGVSAFYYAACLTRFQGHIGILELFTSHKGRVNDVAGPNGYSVLHYVSQGGILSSAEFLVKAGADVFLTTDSGETALDLAVKKHEDEVADYLKTIMAVLSERNTLLESTSTAAVALTPKKSAKPL